MKVLAADEYKILPLVRTLRENQHGGYPTEKAPKFLPQPKHLHTLYGKMRRSRTSLPQLQNC